MHGKRKRRSPLKENPEVVAYDGPKTMHGSAPNPAKSAVQIGKKLYKGADKVSKATVKSKKKEAKHKFTGRKI